MPNLEKLDQALLNLTVDHMFRYGRGDASGLHPEDREVLEHWIKSYYFQTLMTTCQAPSEGAIESALKLGFLAGFRAHQTMQDMAITEGLEQLYGD